MSKKILFLTGTRADYGKLKSLMKRIEDHDDFELYVFVTGMHMLSKYGTTHIEIEKDGFKNIYKYINQSKISEMDITLSNTITGFSHYVAELKPDLIVVHGDRLEALAGAIVGAFNNIKVAHIEGGEISGTIDESIRHAITKFSHFHFVSNNEAKERVIQMGENPESIYVIGSPDIDIMYSDDLPNLDKVKERYGIPYQNYGILMYHPVTTDLHNIKIKSQSLVSSVVNSNLNYIVIYPNNDTGSEFIIEEYDKLKDKMNFKIYPSIRFEYFLTLLKECDFIIGNSSAGIREAGVYGVPCIDIGNRQAGRYDKNSIKHIIHIDGNSAEIEEAINDARKMNLEPISIFGKGSSDIAFVDALKNSELWNSSFQKKFLDIDYL